MKRLPTFKRWPLRIGTNRIVVTLRGKVIKIPKCIRGIRANRTEYENFCQAPIGTVATTDLHFIFLSQERLVDLETYPRDATREEVPIYARGLFDVKVNNRLQIGKDKSGRYKIFDYEDVKFYEKGE